MPARAVRKSRRCRRHENHFDFNFRLFVGTALKGRYSSPKSEADQHEDLSVFDLFPFAVEPAIKFVEEYFASIKKYPNPPAQSVTQFHNSGGG